MRASPCYRSLSLLLVVGLSIFATRAMAVPGKILFVVTAATELKLKDGTTHPTGYYAVEFAVPWKAFARAGYQLEVASPGGVVPTVDPASLELQHFDGDKAKSAETAKWLKELPELNHPKKLADVHALNYVAVFVPGGHGPMQDLMHNLEMGKLLNEALETHRVLGLLCHGPAALASTVKGSSWTFSGYKMTAFSNAEEPKTFGPKMIETPETALKALGAVYSKADAPYAPHVVTDRDLVTGQNPKSAEPIAEAVLAALSKK